jgi:uncharacterized repeat protein (TIGR02543 family)
VLVGESAVFTVEVSLTGTPTYQWKKDGVDITGAKSKTLTITNVDSSKAGNYSVVVTIPLSNSCTVRSSEAVLTVNSGVSGSANRTIKNFAMLAKAEIAMANWSSYNPTLLMSMAAPIPVMALTSVPETNETQIVAGLPDEWNAMLFPNASGADLGLWKPGLGTESWRMLKTNSKTWANQGLRYYKGHVWYRTTIDIDNKFNTGKDIKIWFSSIKETARVWLNGQELELLTKGSSSDSPWEFDATEAIKFGEPNLIVVDVGSENPDGQGAGGIIGPVKLLAVGLQNTYTVTLNSNGGSAVSAITGITSGSAITAPTPPTKTGYTFAGWYKEAALVTAWNFDADKVTSDITLYAKWAQNSSGPSITYHTITANAGEGGKISPQTSNVAENTSKKFTILPDKGYEIADVKVDGKSVGALTSYTFSNVTSSHTIGAIFKKDKTPEVPKEPEYKNPFADVNENNWFYDSVMYVYQQGLMNGVSLDKFNPLEKGSRGMIVTILYTLEGRPEAAVNSFMDVADGKWYTDAITWAAENKIVSGYGKGLFGPNDNITREQMAAIFYNYAKHKGYDLSDTSSLEGFTDNTKVSGWASEALQWMVGSGMMNGKGNNILDPKGTATRAEMASIMQKFAEKYSK